MATFSTGGDMPNYFSTGGDNMGLGGGLLGTLLAVSLLGRGGLGGWGNVGATDAGTSAAVLNANTLDGIQNVLGDIKASVPLAEGQVQIALAGQTANITSQANQNAQAILANQSQLALAAAQNTALIQAELARESNAIQTAITADGAKTRDLITNNMIAELNSRNVILANEISDLKASAERSNATHGINITMLNNQNQNQLQFQQQAQVMNQLAGVLAGMQQSIHATNQAINIGSGSQRANPTNNNTNVTA